MTLKVFILHPFEGEARDLLLGTLSTHIELAEGPELPDRFEYEVLVAGRPERAHLQASPKLSRLVIPFAGLPDVTRDLIADFPALRVYNIHHNAAPTAEMALALLLGAAKFLLPYDRLFRENNWTMRYAPSPAVLLEGKNALILGYGQIGQRLGRALEALGMRVRGVRRDPGQAVEKGAPGEVYALSALHDLIPETDVLVICLPLTPQTAGLLGADELAALPPGCVLVNVGRGPIIDQAALYHALKERRLAAAGLDVWYNYPRTPEERQDCAPADYPFHELDNVVLSPHRAGHVIETESLRAADLADLLNRLADGSEPAPIDPKRGY